jgi:hypothetical protein
MRAGKNLDKARKGGAQQYPAPIAVPKRLFYYSKMW